MTFWKTAALCLVLSTSALHAQELSAEARAAATERVEGFKTSFAAGDMGAPLDYMPPKLLSRLASLQGVDEATLIEMTKANMAELAPKMKFDSVSMNVDAATYQMTPDGSLGYLLIPTEIVMTIEGAGKMKATSDMLAFQDDGQWYLARVTDPSHTALLQDAYPAFAGVTFKGETIEPVLD
ncbi:hypothetical protein [Tabrizicola sp.]|uniref:hypothetical protein n=1 Tax=Tabrizicola sp. TaxID=2005166 RepID=UPI003F2A9816